MINFSSHFIGRCIPSRFVGKVGSHAENLKLTSPKTYSHCCNQDPNLGKERDRDKQDVPYYNLSHCIAHFSDPELVVPLNCVSMVFRSPVIYVSASYRSQPLC